MKLQNPEILDLTQLYNISEQIINNYKQQLEKDNAVASGNLINSIEWNIVQKDENTLTLEMSIAEYFVWVELGRRPTQSNTNSWNNPINDISNWIINKIKRGKLIPKPNQEIPTTQKQIQQVSYAIVNKIHKYGYYDYNSQGKHSLEKSLQKSEIEQLIERFAMALTQPLCGEIVADLKKLEIREKPKVRPKR